MGKTRAELGIKTVRLLTEQHSDGTERWLEMSNAWDLRSPNPSESYGIHGAEMRFGIKRGNIGVTLYWMTPFHLPHVRVELEGKGFVDRLFDGLGGIDYHSPVPLYENASETRGDCEITGGKCFSDGTSLGAGELFDRFVSDPEELWKTLKEWLEDTERRVTQQQEDGRNFV